MPRVVGFTADANLYCPACAERRYGPDSQARRDHEGNGVHAVFSDSEWDCPQHCAACGRFIPVRLTRDGYDYLREQGPRVPEEWRRAYPEAFSGRGER
jgi:hypothetical protein